MTKKKRHLVVPRTEKAMKDGIIVGGKHLTFKGKTGAYVEDAALADDIDKTVGLKGSKDVWIHQDEMLEQAVNTKEGGIHNYFFAGGVKLKNSVSVRDDPNWYEYAPGRWRRISKKREDAGEEPEDKCTRSTSPD